MSVSIWQATLFGIFACLASLPGMGGTVVGNYTLGRPLVGGLICGLIMGDVATGIIAGAAIQIVYIALITPGGAVAADVRAISYIGVPLSIIDSRNSWYSFNVWNSNDEPDLAGIWMEVSGIRKIKEIICS